MEKDNFKKELTTVWSFPERGNWATQSKYRVTLLLNSKKLSKILKGDTVLDPM